MRVLSRCFVFMLSCALVGQAAAQDTKIYSTTKTYHQLSNDRLGKIGKSLKSQFRSKAGYFGAMVMNIPEDKGHAYWNRHSIADATSAAMAACRAKTATPSVCKLYALSLPKGYAQNDSAKSLSQPMTKVLRSGSMADSLKQVPYGAVAVNDPGTWAWATSSVSLEDAKTTALRDCKKTATEDKKTADAVVRKRDWTCSIRVEIDGSKP